jgi:serine/threonine protein kinase
MPTSPTIQNLSPPYVVKVLMSKPYGTYIIRAETSNDKILSSIQINNRSTASIRHRYVVLSVRTDETVYTSPVMNYRLSFTEQNPAKLLEQYHSKRNQLENLPVLEREFIFPAKKPDWTINPKQFPDIEFSKGQFGGKHHSGVAVASWQRPGQQEIKIFIKSFEKNSCHYENESNLLQRLCFFPIITLYGQYSDQKKNYLVFAYGGKSLQSICPIQAQGRESQTLRIVKIAFQLSNAMLYLEKKNIVHRDLTASNVLIDDKGFIRIADFGHAIQKEEGKNNLTPPLTIDGQHKFQIRFLAPECMVKPSSQSQNNQPSIDDQRRLYVSFSSKSDVWAFGILLIQLMLKKPSIPYPDIDDLDIPKHVLNREMHPIPDGCDIDIYYILQQCWAYKPIDRISFTEIREKMKKLISIWAN